MVELAHERDLENENLHVDFNSIRVCGIFNEFLLVLLDNIRDVEELQCGIVGELRNDILLCAVEESLEKNVRLFGVDANEIRELLAHYFLEQLEFLLVLDLALREVQLHPFENEIPHDFILRIDVAFDRSIVLLAQQ